MRFAIVEKLYCEGNVVIHEPGERNVVRLYVFATGHFMKKFDKEKNVYELT